MPKYLGKQIVTHRSFPELGQKQKTEKERMTERLNDGNITMASYALKTPPRVAHTKPPGPTLDMCKNNCFAINIKQFRHLPIFDLFS